MLYFQLLIFREQDVISTKVDLKIDVDDDGDIDSIDDAEEESTGAIVFENWDNDDDDSDFKPDNTENSVSGEDDLVRIELDIEPSSLSTGTVRLESNNTKIKIWESATKNNMEIILPATWDLSTTSVPTELFVEGFNESNSQNDTTLTLSYTAPGGSTPICEDNINITVVRINLGSAAYRAMRPSVISFVGEFDHASLVVDYTGKRKKSDLEDHSRWRVIQMFGTEEVGANILSLLNYRTTALPFHGVYSVDDLEDSERNNIVKNAFDILLIPDIGYIWPNALDWKGLSWDGTIADIDDLRCDGLIEVCYELAQVEVWGKNGTNYLIQNNILEHNNLGKADPQIELSPIVQRGGVPNSPTRMKLKSLYTPNLQ